MDKYKVEYVPTSADHSKWYKVKNIVDGWSLSKEIEALLEEYSKKGYKLVSTEAILTTTNASITKTDGILIVFGKVKESFNKLEKQSFLF